MNYLLSFAGALALTLCIPQLTAGADLDAELIRAARNGDPKQVAQLLASGANVNARDTVRPNIGRTPLHFAAGGYNDQGPGLHLEAASVLVAKGADVNAQAEGGYTPLHVASGVGNEAMVAFLLSRGANPNAVDVRATPLSAAIIQGNLSIVKLLLANGADVNAVAGKPGDRPIDLIGTPASWRPDHDAIFFALLDAGADVRPLEKRGNPLRTAVYRGRSKLALKILNKGGIVDAFVVQEVGDKSDREVADDLVRRNVKVFTGEGIGSTLLHGAACTGNPGFLEWVLSRTPDVNVRGIEGKTAMHRAVSCVNEEAIAALIARRADVNRKDAKGRAPINDFYGADLAPSAKRLLDAGANPNSFGDDGTTALMSAVYVDDADFARLLISRGANPNLKDRNGNTALHEAVRLRKVETARVIFEAKDLRVDERNGRGETALHIAALYDISELIPTLRARGADRSLRTPAGKTALEIADGLGRKRAADLLR